MKSCHDMICYVMIFFWPGRGRGPAPAGAGRGGRARAGPAPGPGRGRAPDKGRDRRAAAQWLSTRTCLPGGWAVEPRTAKKGKCWMKLAGKGRFGTFWPENGIPGKAGAIRTGFGG